VLQEDPLSTGRCKRTQVLVDGVSPALLIRVAMHEVRVNGAEQKSTRHGAREGKKSPRQRQRTGNHDIEPN
jgi:hypothetical protein